jgi:hypothetical protein
VELTRTEFQLVELFMRNVGQVLTRAVIFDRVWDTCTGPSRAPASDSRSFARSPRHTASLWRRATPPAAVRCRDCRRHEPAPRNLLRDS